MEQWVSLIKVIPCAIVEVAFVIVGTPIIKKGHFR
jgi:hypothetical protein